MHYIIPADRHQLSLSNHMDEWVSLDNPVRFIDLLIDKLVIGNPDIFITKGQDQIGRKAYQPATMQKLFLYGYLNSICSSRKLENECLRNIELKWLLGDLHPDHKTISDYRKDNKEAIRFVCISFRKFLKEQGYIDAKKVAYDGSKLKANASREIITKRWVEKRLAKLDENLNKYLDQLQKTDIVEDLEEQLSQMSDNFGVETALLQKIADLQKQIEQLQQYKAFMDTHDLNSYAPSDPEARLMKTRDGFVPAYNMQTGVDDKNKMIIYAQVTNKVTDVDELQPNIEQTKEQLGLIPEIVEADKGFANFDQIQAIEKDQQTTCVVPLPDVKQEKLDNKAEIHFEYDEKNDCMICSEGRKLPLISNNNKKRNQHYAVYQGNCSGCSKKEQCTKSKKGRTVHRNHQKKWIDSYKERSKHKSFKILTKERRTIVEHPFGTIKSWMGKFPLRLRGKEKVQAEIDIFTTAYNIKRLISLENMENLLNMASNFPWKVA
jgi:transposase/Fe-S cluster biogenesis protein NfuA